MVFVSAGPQGWEPMAGSSCHVLASPGRAWEKKSLDKRHKGKDQDVAWWNCYLEKQIPTSEVRSRYERDMRRGWSFSMLALTSPNFS